MPLVKYEYEVRAFYKVAGELEIENKASTSEIFKILREKHNIPDELGIDIKLDLVNDDKKTDISG